MKFTFDQLDPVAEAAHDLEDAVTGVFSELRPLYPDNDMTSGDVDILIAQLDNVREALAALANAIEPLRTAASTHAQEA